MRVVMGARPSATASGERFVPHDHGGEVLRRQDGVVDLESGS
jgi:hypothetical protein